MMGESPPFEAVGAELLDTVIADCRARYSAEPRLKFVQVQTLDSLDHEKRYDAVFCMEVLEHVFDWEPELARMSRLLAPGGTLVVSVPVETGVPVLVKQVVRTVAGWRKVGHYPGTTAYSWTELAAAVFAGRAQHVKRPVFDFGGGPAHDHKGFNWRVLHGRLERQFEITRIVASPFGWLGPGLATQVWFVARLRGASTSVVRSRAAGAS
jgi:SAM-dependent methyltransferase